MYVKLSLINCCNDPAIVDAINKRNITVVDIQNGPKTKG
jgi:hypothetical protein